MKKRLTTHHLLLITYHLPHITYHQPPILYHFPFIPYHLPFTTYHLPTTTYQLPWSTYYLSVTTYHLPLTTYNLPHTTLDHPSSFIYNLIFSLFLDTNWMTWTCNGPLQWDRQTHTLESQLLDSTVQDACWVKILVESPTDGTGMWPVLGYIMQPLSYAWIIEIIMFTSLLTGFSKQKVKV